MRNPLIPDELHDEIEKQKAAEQARENAVAMAFRELTFIYEAADLSDAALYDTVKKSMARMTGSAVWKPGTKLSTEGVTE